MQTTCFSFAGSAEHREVVRAGPETADYINKVTKFIES